MTKTISFDIHAGKDGGVGIYEMVPDQAAELVFGGNTEEATKYLNRRIVDLTVRDAEGPQPGPAPTFKAFVKRNLDNAEAL
jgi:hypothetical protein